MNLLYTQADNPLVQAIKIIGVGKHGSKPLPAALLEEVLLYLPSDEVIPIQKGAFFGALMAKGPTEEERKILYQVCGEGADMETLYNHLCMDSPADMKEIGVKLLKKEFLTVDEAQKLGNYLFSDLPGETFRGMAANMLRIRYETDEEYQGLIQASVTTYTPGFHKAVPVSKTLVQLAEPFDGVEHSYMITPLLAAALHKAGYSVVATVGRSSGPKLTLNALDIYQALGGRFLQNNQTLTQPSPPFGWVLDQKDVSPALDRWVDRRRLIRKRPFLATSEKVLNPCGAAILITSVFHITYMEKMITLANMAGFSGVIVLKRGLEGSLAPSIAKASGILCAARQPDGSFVTRSFDATDENFASYRAGTDETIEQLRVEDNIQLIRHFTQNGFTGNEDFDKRVNLANALYLNGLGWITTML